MSGLTPARYQSPRLEMSSYLRREPWHSGPFEQHEDPRHGRRLAAVGGGLLSHDLDSNAWIQVELVKQELVRMYSDNVVWLQRWLWKSLMLNVTSTSSFPLTAPGRTCLCFGALALPSI